MTTIGRVTYEADIDGRRLPAQARRIGRSAGAELGNNLEKGFEGPFDRLLSDIGRDVESRLRRSGRLGGLNFTNALERAVTSRLHGIADQIADVFASPDGVKKFVSSFDDAGEGIEELRRRLGALRESGSLTDWQFSRLANTVNQYAADMDVARARTIDARRAQADMHLTSNQLNESLDRLANEKLRDYNINLLRTQVESERVARETQRVREAFDQHTRVIELNNDELELSLTRHQQLGSESDKTTSALSRQSSGWKSLSHNTRQWILIGSAIAVSMETISVLGSAVGSSITVLAGSLGAAGVGIGTMIAAFQDLNGEISALPEPVQAAAAAWQSLGDAFGVLQDKIQVAALQGAAGAFESLRGTVEALTPAFELVAGAVGRVIDAFAASIGPGTQGFENLVALISGAAPIFETLASAAMIFGTALGNIFVAALPFVQIFADWLSQLAQRFLDWTNSLEGQNALQEWFENGVTIMSALEPLIGAVAKALSDLVTPEAIERTVTFIEGLTEFMPILSDILGVLGELNILNIFVELLNAIGTALQPIIPELSTMAMVLGDALIYGIKLLTPALTDLFIAFAPLLPIVAQLASAFLFAAIEAILPVAEVIVTQLIPALIPLFQALIPLIPAIIEIGVVLGANLAQAIIALMPVIIPLIDLTVQLLLALEPIIPVVLLLIQSALGPLIAIVQIVAAAIGVLISVVVAIIKPFVDMGRQILEATGGVQGINDTIDTSIAMFRDWGSAVGDVISGIIGWIEDALGWFADLFGAASNAPTPSGSGGSGRSGSGGGGMATGGLANFAQRRLIGEAGREAVVPLQRPLSQVDPSVRMLAAFAQGKLGNMGGAGKQVNFYEGSIIVQTVVPDGRLVAESVIDRVAANAGEL